MDQLTIILYLVTKLSKFTRLKKLYAAQFLFKDLY